ncbi:MAG: hypothetical protein ABI771_12260 [Betaproteobacteria bacterium]
MNPSGDFLNGATLHLTDGRVVLSLHDSQYAADDLLPADIQRPAVREPAYARHFVSACMIIEYGRNETQWPEIARRFVLDR